MNEALFNFLSWINSWVGSWGWAMVIFTILIRLVLTPLDFRVRFRYARCLSLPNMDSLLSRTPLSASLIAFTQSSCGFA